MNDEKNEGANESTPAAGSRLAVDVPETLKWLRTPKALNAEVCCWAFTSVGRGLDSLVWELEDVLQCLERESPLNVAAWALHAEACTLNDLADHMADLLLDDRANWTTPCDGEDYNARWQRRIRLDREVDMETLGKMVVHADRLFQIVRDLDRDLSALHKSDPENPLPKELDKSVGDWFEQARSWMTSSKELWCAVIAARVIQGQSGDQPVRPVDQEDHTAETVVASASDG